MKNFKKNQFLFIGLALVFTSPSTISQTMNLLCDGIVSHYEVNESVIPYKRKLKSEYKAKKTYFIKDGKLDLHPIKECSITDENIYCKGGIKDSANPNVERFQHITINRISGEVYDEDYTKSGMKKEIYFDGICLKAKPKF